MKWTDGSYSCLYGTDDNSIGMVARSAEGWRAFDMMGGATLIGGPFPTAAEAKQCVEEHLRGLVLCST